MASDTLHTTTHDLFLHMKQFEHLIIVFTQLWKNISRCSVKETCSNDNYLEGAYGLSMFCIYNHLLIKDTEQPNRCPTVITQQTICVETKLKLKLTTFSHKFLFSVTHQIT